ncbi:MAG: DUF1501 domain-containing protein [Myxococcaceae bacterium]
MMHFNRRFMLKSLAAGLSALTLPSRAKAEGAAPHFFLQLVVSGGMDQTYLFDARPWAMTQAGLLQNYLKTEPTVWNGTNDVSTLAASTTGALRPYAADLAIVNGVIMSSSFDGHDQNMNVLFTGNPFGGTSFLTQLNQDAPLDYLRQAFLFADLDDSRFVQVDPSGARELSERLKARGVSGSRATSFLQTRYDKSGGGLGRLSAGARSLLDAAKESARLEAALRKVTLAPPAPDPNSMPGSPPAAGATGMVPQLEVVAEYFRHSIVRSALLEIRSAGGLVDTHDAESAKAQPQLYASVAESIAQVLKYLKETPYDAASSLLDVTTVMVSSEFGRTMRQENLPIDATGTDHNPLCNSLMLAGKGVRGGTVSGGSDQQQAGEALSGAHLALDAKKLKMMGRPVDFVSGRPTAAQPAAYDPAQYLTIASVVNTVYSLFGVDASKYMELGRNLPKAPVLQALLK